MMSPAGPEDKAREEIDRLLEAAGWYVCDFDDRDISRNCAIREFPLKSGHGHVDYLLYLHGKAVGVIEAPIYAEYAQNGARHRCFTKKKKGVEINGVRVKTQNQRFLH